MEDRRNQQTPYHAAPASLPIFDARSSHIMLRMRHHPTRHTLQYSGSEIQLDCVQLLMSIS
ncbi:hypothetical protein BD309DRAFT_958331, partial [Dichomitus squalens]